MGRWQTKSEQGEREMNERIRELAEQAKLRPTLLLKHLGTFAALTDSEQQELKNIEKFVELVQADEREACAKIVEQYCGAWNDQGYALAQEIRARGEK
jgi:hypothetical protein